MHSLARAVGHPKLFLQNCESSYKNTTTRKLLFTLLFLNGPESKSLSFSAIFWIRKTHGLYDSEYVHGEKYFRFVLQQLKHFLKTGTAQ
jgi:hypothetical protein